LAGAYTDIISITAPSSAAAGEIVNVTIIIKSTANVPLTVSVAGVYDSEERFIDGLTATIYPGLTHSFSGSFAMPSSACTIHAYSSYWGVDGLWHLDDEAAKNVNLTQVQEEWVELGSVTYLSVLAEEEPVEVWVELGSITSLSVIAGQTLDEWHELGSITDLVLAEEEPVEVWVELGSITSLSVIAGQTLDEWHELGSITDLAVIPLAVGGWIYLGQLTDFSLTPAGVEPPPPCSVDSDCDEGYICVDGQCVLAGEEEGKPFPWLPVALGAGALAVGIAAFAGKKKLPTKAKGKAKTS